MQNEKKVYETPKLAIHGNVAEITQANKLSPTRLDADFEVGDDLGDVTTGTDNVS